MKRLEHGWTRAPERRRLAAGACGIVCLFALTAADGFSSPGTAGTRSAAAATPAKAVAITVTAGKPTEFAFKLSKTQVPPGMVAFHVTNAGKVAHTFEICSGVNGGTANSCKGKVTKALAHGKSQVLTVVLAKGRHEFLCTIPGHAAAGMKGVLGVGVAPGAGPKTPQPVTSRPATTTTTTTTTATTTTAPAATTTTAAPTGPTAPLVGDPTAGAAVFQSAGCGGCHTLKAANSTGTAGPNLDFVAPDQQTVITNVTFGNAMGMPAFSPAYSATQIANVAAYVYASTH